MAKSMPKPQPKPMKKLAGGSKSSSSCGSKKR
jgi:hypothetical protein